jgi:hypothetical protein
MNKKEIAFKAIDKPYRVEGDFFLECGVWIAYAIKRTEIVE